MTTSSKPVTVITPSFNQAPFIRATIESVLSQDYPNLEYILMDGGSDDATAAIAGEYSSRLTFISEPDRGQSHAINKGVRLAKGEYFAWLNSDDTLLPGAIRRTVAALEGAPPCGAVYGDGFLIDREGAVIERFPYTQPFDLQKLIYVSDYILQQSVLFRKSAFEEAGYLDEDLHYAMDWDILIRIGKRRPLLYLPEDIGCLRVYPETKTSSGGAPRVAEIRRVMQRHTGLRWAPGYVTYGLETYRELWCEWIQSRTPAGLQAVSTLLQRTIRAAANTVIGHQHVNWQSRIPEASRG